MQNLSKSQKLVPLNKSTHTGKKDYLNFPTIICNTFSIGYKWCSKFLFFKIAEISNKLVAVSITRNVSVE